MPGSFKRRMPNGKTYRFHPIRMDETWFDDGSQNGTAPASGTDVVEWAQFEVGNDNQAAEYDAIIVGQPSDDDRKPGKTVEWHLARHDSSSEDTVDPGLETKAIVRPRSARDGDEIVNFGSHARLNQTTPSEQIPVPIQQTFAPNGKVVALHSRDPAGNDGVNRLDSSLEIQGYGGFEVS